MSQPTFAPPAAARPSPKSRSLLVDPALQFRATVPVAVVLGVFSLLLVGYVLLPLHKEVNGEPDPHVQALMGGQLAAVQLRIMIAAVVATFWAALFAVLQSASYARPLLRLRSALSDLANGVPAAFETHRGERFQEFGLLVSQLNQKMDRIGRRNRDLLLSVHGPLKYLSGRLTKEDVPQAEVQAVLKEVVTLLNKSPIISPSAAKEEGHARAN
ncbi:MAG: hypothetical protein HY234_02060 [Acidobacteria bacterium]|nr:hypothetical protein [Acidobacteriota bacterium]MBI3661824.1 hypothetical protein [Acidobacteriota bacterium]